MTANVCVCEGNCHTTEALTFSLLTDDCSLVDASVCKPLARVIFLPVSDL